MLELFDTVSFPPGVCRAFRNIGDEEGILVFSKMPDAVEAATLRSYIGLRQTREMSPDRAQVFNRPARKGSSSPCMRYSELEAHKELPHVETQKNAQARAGAGAP